MATHWNVMCDGCELSNLVHYRYKCLRCVDYDLCRTCYDNKVETGTHNNNHPFQCLLDRAARELYFDGETVPELSADSFTCPFCGKMGHAAKELVKHVQSKHRGDSTLVICPLCVAVSSADAQRMSNLVNHVSLMHGTGILRIGGGATAGGGGGGGSSGSAAGGGGGSVTHVASFSMSPLAQHQSHSRGHSHYHSLAHSHANSLAHSQGGPHVHAHSHGHFHGPSTHSYSPYTHPNGHVHAHSHAYAGHAHGRSRGNGFGPVYYAGSNGSLFPLDLSSSASQEDDIFAESWLAERSSVSGSMHTMRDADLDLGNRARLPGIQMQLTRAPLASEETCSELDSDDDYETSDSRI